MFLGNDDYPPAGDLPKLMKSTFDPMCCLGLTPRRLLKNSDADYDVLR